MRSSFPEAEVTRSLSSNLLKKGFTKLSEDDARVIDTNELVAKLGMKNLSKGVKIEVADGKVSVELAINLEYGYNIPEVTGAVQDRVKSAIETMTGLSVEGVNIRVAGVNLEDE